MKIGGDELFPGNTRNRLLSAKRIGENFYAAIEQLFFNYGGDFMKILITGSNGQLGNDVVKRLKSQGHTVCATDIDNMDITSRDDVYKAFLEFMPDSVIHCAAYTAVDAAEEHVKECMNINSKGTRNIAEICRDLNVVMMYISTDYVFDGTKALPYNPDDFCNPINTYGLSKREGELAVLSTLERFFIIRISWVFGIAGNNFVKTMLRLAKQNQKLSIISDQIGSPTYTYDLAILLSDMITSEKFGIYHASNEGYCSWFEFASEIFRLSMDNILVQPISSKDYPTKAKRPLSSMLNKDKLELSGFEKLPNWKNALSRFWVELGNE